MNPVVKTTQYIVDTFCLFVPLEALSVLVRYGMIEKNNDSKCYLNEMDENNREQSKTLIW